MEDHCLAVGVPVEPANETVPQRGLVLPLTATFLGVGSASPLRGFDESSARGAATTGVALEPRGDRA